MNEFTKEEDEAKASAKNKVVRTELEAKIKTNDEAPAAKIKADDEAKERGNIMTTKNVLAPILKNSSSDSLLTPSEAATYIGVSKNTLSVWRCVGRYAIPFIKVGRLVRYRRSALDTWLESRTHSNEIVEDRNPIVIRESLDPSKDMPVDVIDPISNVTEIHKFSKPENKTMETVSKDQQIADTSLVIEARDDCDRFIAKYMTVLSVGPLKQAMLKFLSETDWLEN